MHGKNASPTSSPPPWERTLMPLSGRECAYVCQCTTSSVMPTTMVPHHHNPDPLLSAPLVDWACSTARTLELRGQE